MASIKERGDSYLVTVSCGRNVSGKKLTESKTFHYSTDNLSEKDKRKERNENAVLFERAVKQGRFLDGEKITLAGFAEIWIRDYAEKELEASTLKTDIHRVRERIIPALGHLKMAKIQPHHVRQFINNLKEDGIRLDLFYRPNEEFVKLMAQTKTYPTAKALGIDPKTYYNAKNGGKMKLDAAQKLCEYFEKDLTKDFQMDGKKSQLTLSEKTVKHHFDLLSRILGTAVLWGVIVDNPCNRTQKPKTEHYKPQYYEEEELSKLFEALETAPLKYKVSIYLYIDIGCRESEASALLWSDIDWDKNRITINKQRQYISGKGNLKKDYTKTPAGERSVTLSDSMKALLLQFKEEQEKNKSELMNLYNDSDYIFVHEDGTLIHPNRPYHWLTAFLEKNGLSKITIHQLRHTNASLMISDGVDAVTMASRLGHENPNTTLGIYSHIIKSKEHGVANNMENIYKRMRDNRVAESGKNG